MPVSDQEMTRVTQEFSYPGIACAVPRYFNSSTFRSEWLDRRNRLLKSWTCPVLIMEGYDNKTQPREFYLNAREYIPNAPEVQVRYMPGGHFGGWEVQTKRLMQFVIYLHCRLTFFFIYCDNCIR